MKPLLLLAALLVARIAPAQQLLQADQVPPLAFVALQTHFPHARNVQWEQSYGFYKASFRQSQSAQAALFSNYGDLEETVFPVLMSALPAPVRHALTTYYPGMKLSALAQMVNAATGAVTYEAKMLEDGETCTVLFTADGHEVRKSRRK